MIILNTLIQWFIKIQVMLVLPFFFKTKIIGRHHMRFKSPVIIMSNHISTWDAVLFFCTFWTRTLYFLAASILFTYNKLFAWFIRSLGAVRVKREGTDLFAIDESIRLIETGHNLVIFPEGMRSLTREILPFRPGVAIVALMTGAPIIPVFIGGKYGVFSRIKMAVGEPIYLRATYGAKYPTAQELKDICAMLRNHVVELSKQFEVIEKPARDSL
jgi:1-acyl-sn-glycerol-3-phosphate acyltransferase